MGALRVALVGLSAASKTSWAADAHLPYLLSSRGKSRYQIAALLNSSKAAAEKAIEEFGLPASTKAYGSPDDLAADPDIDLTVVCTRVDVHYQVAQPLLRAGRTIYVEWPLAQNKTLAAELADAARVSNSKTIVGTQARVAPYVLRIKELLSSGAIGKVISSDVKTFHSNTPNAGLLEGLEYFTDSKIGGNIITIAFAHTIDGIHSVLGEYETFDTRAALIRPIVDLTSEGKVVRQVRTDIPDEVFVHGPLQGSHMIRKGAVLTISYRRNPVPFPDEPAFTWSIFGETGQLRVTLPNNTFWNVDSSDLRVRLHRYGTDEIETIPWQYEMWQEELPGRSRNIAELYERFADGRVVPTFEDAVRRHAEVDQILDTFHRQQQSQ